LDKFFKPPIKEWV